MVYTLTTAAQAVGKTRQAIQAAIAKGTISAKKDAHGHWQIDAAELHRVYAPTGQPASNGDKPVDSAAVLEAKLIAAEQLIQTIKQQADELRIERDAWKQQAHEWMILTKVLPEGDPTRGDADKPKRGFFARIFGT